jgi:tRNA A-37 threonylcarbamoyl transferase component Bud32/RNA polymerase subunit RPABC4/transcription elongation factor Spt4
LKSCPNCKRVYPDDAGFCPVDGTALAYASMVPVANAEDARIGTRLCNRYELRRVVADGGMGRVYEGIDKQTNTRIAVKVLHEDVSKDEVSLERFKREYEISSKLPHDHIVNVLDFQRDPTNGVWLLVMEFLDGEELRVVLKREKTIPPERVIRMLSQAAIALDAAHKMHVVHRDLKPDNLFLVGTHDGDVVKLLDFGSVKDKSKDAKKLTVLGTTIGSPYYMAPEQAQGLDTLDARADVFALAAITYECMCGTVPFGGTNGPSILLAIMTKDPDPPTLKGAREKWPIPPAMDDVMEVALAKNPNIRTKTVGDLADAVGHAYGLEGEHRGWATTSQPVLAQQVAAAKDRVMKPRPTLDVAPDPFLQADPFAAGAGAAAGAGGYGAIAMAPHGMPQHASHGMQGGRGMDAAFSQAREADYEMAPIVPPRPAWLIPVIVGVAALLVGGGIALVVVLAQ